MSFFQYEHVIRQNSSSERSVDNEKDVIQFQWDIPVVSEKTSESSRDHDNQATHAINRGQWILSSTGIFMLVILGPVTIALLHQFIVRFAAFKKLTGDDRACGTDPVWTSWATLFQVNIRSGDLSFTAAKIIDMAWDTIIGRGGQFLLGWISYHVYGSAITYLAESEAVDFELFTITVLFGHSVWTFLTALRALFSGMSRRAICISIWMIMSMLYVLVFPTLLSASTSYVVASRTVALLVDNTTVPVRTYLDSAYLMLSDHQVEAKPSPWYIPVNNITGIPASIDQHLMLFKTSRYATMGSNLTVDDVAYFISNATTSRSGFYYNNYFYDRTDLMFYSVMNDRQLLPTGKILCQPDGENYLWGASFELLVILQVTLSLWAISMWIAWIVSRRGSILARKQREMGCIRAILDIARPIREAGCDNESNMTGEDELRRKIRHRAPVRYRIERSLDGEISSVNLVEQCWSSEIRS